MGKPIFGPGNAGRVRLAVTVTIHTDRGQWTSRPIEVDGQDAEDAIHEARRQIQEISELLRDLGVTS